jgi:hypothetical protein
MTNILDEHAPRCKMRVRERDVPYMTTAWKRAIRAKRRAAQLIMRNVKQPKTLN